MRNGLMIVKGNVHNLPRGRSGSSAAALDEPPEQALLVKVRPPQLFTQSTICCSDKLGALAAVPSIMALDSMAAMPANAQQLHKEAGRLNTVRPRSHSVRPATLAAATEGVSTPPPRLHLRVWPRSQLHLPHFDSEKRLQAGVNILIRCQRLPGGSVCGPPAFRECQPAPRPMPFPIAHVSRAQF